MSREYMTPPPETEKETRPIDYEHLLAKDDIEMKEALENIWDIAEEYKLDPFPTHFEVVPPNVMNQIGSSGIPNRYSHWTFGREFHKMQTQYNYGLSKIYELVINSNPSQAFLLENNPPVENKFVMAHVLGHTDFFKNNFRFAPTRRDMPNAVSRNAERIRSYEETEGFLQVEEFLDAALSIEQHTDPFSPERLSRDDELKKWREANKKQNESNAEPLDEWRESLHLSSDKTTEQNLGSVALRIPPKPDRDILGFIRNHAPYLEEWQRDILDVVRSESIYLYPQRRTKIMNEGWAAYWHKRIMREMSNRELITAEEDEVWWRTHSGVVAPNPQGLNPYYLGMKLYEYIEDYYNGNLTDKETAWLQENDQPIYPHFEGPLQDSPGLEKIREVMSDNDDQSIIRNYFDKNMADRMNMYIYDKQRDPFGNEHNVIVENGWQAIREKLVSMLDNAGTPYINVIDGDHNKAGELYLRHEFDGRTLDMGYINKTLPYIYKLWQRPVHIETNKQDGTPIICSYDGSKVTTRDA